MSSEWELDEGIKSIKSAWRREHTARCNLEKILENVEPENAKLKEENAALRTQLADVTESIGRMEERCAKLRALCRDMHLVVELLDMDGVKLQAHGKDADWRTLKERFDELMEVDA